MTIEHARQVREEKASVMRGLRSGMVSLRDTVKNPPDCLGATSVGEVIEGARNMGPVGAKRTLEASGVWYGQRLGLMTKYERNLIVKCLPKRAK